MVLSNLPEHGADASMPREPSWFEGALARFDERFLQPWFGVQDWQDWASVTADGGSSIALAQQAA